MKISGDELNNILNQLDDLVGTQTIQGGKLDRYKVKMVAHGDHRHDGQIVDYTLIFTSPEKNETKVETKMCLMIGWNFDFNKIINFK